MSEAKHTVKDTQEQIIDKITQRLKCRFPSFGGGVIFNDNNPISHATKDEPPMFALGVDIRKVVEAVIELEQELRDE